MIQQTNSTPVESYKRLYDGDYANFNKFNGEVESLIRPINSLATHIIEGTISVVKMKRGPKTNYRQEGRITTSIELLHAVMRTYERAGNTDLAKLTEDTLLGCSKAVIDTIKEIVTDHSESAEATRLMTPGLFYPKSVTHSTGKLDEEIPWGELIENIESEES